MGKLQIIQLFLSILNTNSQTVFYILRICCIFESFKYQINIFQTNYQVLLSIYNIVEFHLIENFFGECDG